MKVLDIKIRKYKQHKQDLLAALYMCEDYSGFDDITVDDMYDVMHAGTGCGNETCPVMLKGRERISEWNKMQHKPFKLSWEKKNEELD